jgi:hypothetical protein
MARFRVGHSTVRRAFNQLEQSGIATRTKRGTFDLKTQEAKATEWFIPSLCPPQSPAAVTTVTSTPLPAVTTDTPIDKIDIDKRRGLPTKEEVEKEERRKRWLAEGKSEFTGIPKWQRGGR